MKWLMVLGSIMMLLVGCAETSQNEGASSPQNERVKVRQTMPEQRSGGGERNDAARRLERLAESVAQVQSANCVVMGDMAIVGIDVGDKLDAARVGTVKYSVAEALKRDPQGKNAVVTADMDLTQRIRDIRDSIEDGRPISGFADQIADIVGRIMPQLPQDTMQTEDADQAPKMAPRQTSAPGNAGS